MSAVHRAALVTALGMIALTMPSAAVADVIPAGRPRPVCTPISCPTGSTSFSTGHGACPRNCTPWSMECSATGTCEPGWDCVPARFCVEEGYMGRTDGPIVRGECAPDGTCAVGECWDRPRCVPSSSGAPASGAARMSSSSCIATPPSAAHATPIAVAAVVAMLAASRHRSRTSRANRRAGAGPRGRVDLRD